MSTVRASGEHEWRPVPGLIGYEVDSDERRRRLAQRETRPPNTPVEPRRVWTAV